MKLNFQRIESMEQALCILAVALIGIAIYFLWPRGKR